MKLKSNLLFSLPSALALISFTFVAGTAQAQTWANSNITATPDPIRDWFTGDPNPDATWTGGTPVSGSSTTLNTSQFSNVSVTP